MNLLITGGAGFIGSHIQDQLIKKGHTVAVLDSLRSGKVENIDSQSKFYKVDMRDKEELKNAIQEFSPQAIFHLAAQNEVPYSMEHPDEDHDINIIGMMNLLESVKDLKSKVIYSNTGGAYYGEVEPSQIPIAEDTPVKLPTSFYGVSKMCAEAYLKLYGNVYKVPWVSLRYSNVYGPRQDGNREAGIVAIFTSKMLKGETPTIFGDGSHTRDYVYVEDVADANIAALDYKHNDYFNISTGVQNSNNLVFEVIKKHMQLDMNVNYGPNRPGDPLLNALDPSKAEKLMGWKAKTSFVEGVKKTVDYYLGLKLESVLK